MIKINLKNTFTHNKLLLFSILILVICSSFALDISICRFVAARQNELVLGENASDFTVCYEHEFGDEIIEKTNSIISKYKNIKNAYIIFDNDVPVYSYILGDDYISIGNSIQAENEIIIGSKTKELGYEIGDKLELFGKIYTVCGIRPMRDYDEIDYNGITSQKNIKEIHIIFDKVQSNRSAIKIEKFISSQFTEASIVLPEAGNVLDGIMFQLKTALIIIIIAFINLMIVFEILIKKRTAVFKVSRVCGANKSYVFFSLFTELSLYVILGFCIGSGLFASIMNNSISKAGITWFPFSCLLYFSLYVLTYIVIQPAFYKKISRLEDETGE